MTSIKIGDKVKIRQSVGVPGFGGLNFRSLRKDGWDPEMLVTVFNTYDDGSVKVRWDDGTYTWENWRILRPSEIVIPPRSFESLPEPRLYSPEQLEHLKQQP